MSDSGSSGWPEALPELDSSLDSSGSGWSGPGRRDGLAPAPPGSTPAGNLLDGVQWLLMLVCIALAASMLLGLWVRHRLDEGKDRGGFEHLPSVDTAGKPQKKPMKLDESVVAGDADQESPGQLDVINWTDPVGVDEQ